MASNQSKQAPVNVEHMPPSPRPDLGLACLTVVSLKPGLTLFSAENTFPQQYKLVNPRMLQVLLPCSATCSYKSYNKGFQTGGCSP